jgi:hypothetical protein
MSDEPRRVSDQTTATFIRGLTVGALLGAVIAGSSIWSRRVAARKKTATPGSSDATKRLNIR